MNETRIAPTEANGVYSFDLHLIRAEYGLETFGATSDLIRLMVFYLKPYCVVVGLEK